MVYKDAGEILYSELIIDELKLEYTYKQIKEILNIQAETRKVQASVNQVQEAEILGRVRSVGFGDAMHIVLTRDNNAILVTRDKHFINLSDIAVIKKPEEII
ncbi:hypothetical protein COV16_04065 [Candidatus Woesearchaeota archaeon CG10_big_fil_rev_8_21_14_0_10_34_8]|nr:MAG: hypothetical protein COV16_04065 [Candidatus Woesearchaeota archaeon CG10_big_fil_rev_8_21_14_0_10_34_8]